ncbi:MAG TPA: DNA gyrase inhibitor YacG [Xanthobacteraceae bacterium]
MSENRDRLGAAACPVCRNPTAEEFRPFCSRRCADIDLNRWLSGVYAIPVTEDTDEDGTAQAEQER